MLSAHLACFAWRTPQAGAAIINQARRLAAARGFPTMFTTVADRDLAPLDKSLGLVEKIVAPATVYGAGLQAGPAWSINSSEI